MLSSFVKADVICRKAGRVFTVAEHRLYGRQIQRALQSYNYLAAESISKKEKNWKIVPKFHAITHIAYDSRANPRRNSAYDDEDIVGQMKRLYNTCHVMTAALRTLQRYVLQMCLKWWEILHEIRSIPWI